MITSKMHLFKKCLTESQVLTACGFVVDAEDATTDCVEVDCGRAGCASGADAAFDQRKDLLDVKW